MIPKITQERPNVAPKYWCGTCAMRYHRRMALKHAQTRCHGSSVPSVVSPSSMTRQNLSGGLNRTVSVADAR